MRRLLAAICIIMVAATYAPLIGAEGRKAGDRSSSSPALRTQSNLPSDFEMLLTHYHFENDGTGRKEVAARIRILNSRGVLQRGEMTFDYRPFSEELQIPYVRVRKNDGTIVAVETDVVQQPPSGVAPQYDLDERRVKIPGLAPGDLIEYDVVNVLHRPLGLGEFNVNHNFQPSGVLNEQLEVDIPRGRAVKVKVTTGIRTWKTGDSSRMVYHWKKLNSDLGQNPSITWRPNHTPDVQVSSFLSWEEVGRWYEDLGKSQRAPSPEVKAKADELTSGRNSDSEKVEALYNFAAKKIRYMSLISLGIGGYVPHSASETLHSQYGDCKDKVALLAALLEAEGLHASSVLISPERELDPDLPSPWPFTHVIAMLHLGKDEVWMDPSPAVLPFGMLAYPLRGKQSLVMPPGGAPHFEQTPVDAAFPNTLTEEVDGKVAADGALQATVHIVAHGDSELSLRQAFIGPVESIWPAIIQNLVEGIDRKTDTVSEVEISDPTATNEPFTLSFRIGKPFFVRLSKGAATLELPFADSLLPSAESESAVGWQRPGVKPFQLGPPGEYAYRIRLELAPHTNLTAPPPLDIIRDYAVYNSSYKLDGNVLIGERRLVRRKDNLPAAIAENYSTFRKKVLADQTQSIALKVSAQGSAGPE